MRYGDFYAGIEAGGQSFHLKLVDTPDPSIPFVAEGEHFHLYLAVDDLAGFADRLERGGIALVQPIREQPWGMRELAFQDDSGHTIYAGERIAP